MSSRRVKQVVAASDVGRVGQARGAHRPVAQLLLAHRHNGREALRISDVPSTAVGRLTHACIQLSLISPRELMFSRRAVSTMPQSRFLNTDGYFMPLRKTALKPLS